MWILYGERFYGSGEEIIAQFSTEELAEKYIEAATLKSPRFSNVFKRKSLLHSYDSTRVEWSDEIPLDPPIDF